MLSGYKTHIVSAVGVLLGLTELIGWVDWPFIEDPMTAIQVGLSSSAIRLGIGKPIQES
jgi:hypothetical protein